MASTFGNGMSENEEDAQAMQKIKVAVRVRPLMPQEMQNGDDGSKIVADMKQAAINVFSQAGDNSNGSNFRTFKFDQVFD